MYDNLQIDTANLKIPHRELNSRGFLKHLLALMGVESWKFNKLIEHSFIRTFTLNPAFVGVVNITEDSFSDGRHFYHPDQAVKQVHKLVNDGATVVELGAQFTRPGSIVKSPEQEYLQLKPVLDRLARWMQKEVIQVSIDTFWPSLAIKLIENYKIKWINNVKGNFDDFTLRIIAESKCKYCCMHSITIPPSPNKVIPLSQEPIKEIIKWGERTISKLLKLGLSLENIILDPGIGFGKSAYQNIEILRQVDELKCLGALLMVGHSRKSYIRAFSSEINPSQRDVETVILSLALRNKVDFLRIHNVKEHMRAFVTQDIINTKAL